MKELVDYLNARTAEYDSGNPTISDEEWDNKYFELIKMEKLSSHYWRKFSFCPFSFLLSLP